ncbi:ATP-binding protein [Streptomyces boninensis]|uniref:ATP-binding protein n=1 Tax=Streptomyces boninensis TaxID=2039455 RepID=UPI003B2176AE
MAKRSGNWEDGEILLTAAGHVAVEQFDGSSSCVSRARDAASAFLADLAPARPPNSPENNNDVLLVVSELAANSVRHAPGPFTLTLRDTGDAVHVAVRDTSARFPQLLPMNRFGTGGIGWNLIRLLACDHYAVAEPDGKSVHVFLPW